MRSIQHTSTGSATQVPITERGSASAPLTILVRVSADVTVGDQTTQTFPILAADGLVPLTIIGGAQFWVVGAATVDVLVMQ